MDLWIVNMDKEVKILLGVHTIYVYRHAIQSVYCRNEYDCQARRSKMPLTLHKGVLLCCCSHVSSHPIPLRQKDFLVWVRHYSRQRRLICAGLCQPSSQTANIHPLNKERQQWSSSWPSNSPSERANSVIRTENRYQAKLPMNSHTHTHTHTLFQLAIIHWKKFGTQS